MPLHGWDPRLYGTTGFGGSFGDGTLFAINSDGSGYTNFYSFGSVPNDGRPRRMVSHWLAPGSTAPLNPAAASAMLPPINFTSSATEGTVPLNVQFTSPSVDGFGHALRTGTGFLVTAHQAQNRTRRIPTPQRGFIPFLLRSPGKPVVLLPGQSAQLRSRLYFLCSTISPTAQTELRLVRELSCPAGRFTA